jgi:hypothetical protein
MRLRPALFALLASAALLAGCAAPATTRATQAPPSQSLAPAPTTATPVGAPLGVAPSPARATPVQVDTRCGRDADCAVKNVGSCCGELPACVNADSPTDPAAVQAECRASGRMSVCGFRQVSACQCQAGTCMPADGGADGASDPAPVR